MLLLEHSTLQPYQRDYRHGSRRQYVDGKLSKELLADSPRAEVEVYPCKQRQEARFELPRLPVLEQVEKVCHRCSSVPIIPNLPAMNVIDPTAAITNNN